jgi:hypothetical protein
MKFKELIRSQDFFGHKVELNFNKKGSAHNTMFGGIVSIFVEMFIIVFIYVNLKKLILKEDDTLKSVELPLDLEKLGEVKLNETKIDLFFRISDQNGKSRYQDEYKRFFEVQVVESKKNMENFPNIKYERVKKELGTCEKEDFREDSLQEELAIFALRGKFLCIKGNNNVGMLNKYTSIESKALTF